MTVTIDIPPDEEARLQRRAARQGKDITSFLHDVAMREATQESYLEQPQEGQSLAEALEGFIGILSSKQKNGGEASHVAENTGEEFANILVQKYKAGHL